MGFSIINQRSLHSVLSVIAQKIALPTECILSVDFKVKDFLEILQLSHGLKRYQCPHTLGTVGAVSTVIKARHADIQMLLCKLPIADSLCFFSSCILTAVYNEFKALSGNKGGA